MISVHEAIRAISTNLPAPTAEQLPIALGLGRILARDVLAATHLPPFRQCAMDGYLLPEGAHTSGERFRVVCEIKAGDGEAVVPAPGEAFRVFTGAMLPEGSGPVAMQEWVQRQGDEIVVLRPVGAEDNVRPKGSVIKSGSTALRAGTLLTPGALGHLASVGIAKVDVWCRPSIALLTTGNEAVPLDTEPRPGQVFECNSVAITAALTMAGFKVSVHEHVPDDPMLTSEALISMVILFDCVIMTGGVSVGDHDHVAKSIAAAGATTVFHKVNQKPGKPFLFAKRDRKLIFGLPGNPAAALTCLCFYVIPALRQICGHPTETVNMIPLHSAYAKTDGKAHLVRYRLTDGEAQPISGQTSAELATFSMADGIALFPEKNDETAVGTPVQVFCFHQSY
jgi:molybdopterin molybdotransferase